LAAMTFEKVQKF